MCESVKGPPEGISADAALAGATADDTASFNAALARRRMDMAAMRNDEIADAQAAAEATAAAAG